MGHLKETDLVMVNELLTASNDWNEPLIRGIFFAPDVDSILSIPLRSTGVMTGWHGPKKIWNLYSSVGLQVLDGSASVGGG
jgi:hypothetical protein